MLVTSERETLLKILAELEKEKQSISVIKAKTIVNDKLQLISEYSDEYVDSIERKALLLGKMSDTGLADEALNCFINSTDEPTTLKYITALKQRVYWLSTKLESLISKRPTPYYLTNLTCMNALDKAMEAITMLPLTIENVQSFKTLKDLKEDMLYPSKEQQQKDLYKKVLNQIRLRLHFVGWPAESYWNVGSKEKPMWRPDWRYESQLIENALHGTQITLTERPSDSVPHNQLKGNDHG